MKKSLAVVHRGLCRSILVFYLLCFYIYLFLNFRSNNSIPLPDDSRPSPTPGKMQTNDSISSSTIENTKINSPPNRQLNDELNSQQGKRKYSLSQYQEHKRLKSNDIVQNSSADIDMRISTMENIKVRIKIENFKLI